MLDADNESSLEEPRRCRKCRQLKPDVRVTSPFTVALCDECWVQTGPGQRPEWEGKR